MQFFIPWHAWGAPFLKSFVMRGFMCVKNWDDPGSAVPKGITLKGEVQ